MNEEIERLIEQGRETVTAKYTAKQAEEQAMFDAELKKRLDAWAQVCEDVRSQLPEALWDYLELEKGRWQFMNRELEYGYPMPAGDEIDLEVPGLQRIYIRVNRPEDIWKIEYYRVQRASDYENGKPAKPIFCDQITEALYHAQVQAEEAIRLEELYTEQMREYEEQERMEHEPKEQVIDPEELLKQARAKLILIDDQSEDAICRALIAIGWMIFGWYK